MITHQLYVEPSAMAVALPEEQVDLCHEVLGQAGLRVHRDEHVLAACKRITKLLPQVVVASAMLRSEVREMIEDRAVAVGAVLVELHPDRDVGTASRDLDDAVSTARRRLGRQPRNSA
jgi:hypothetical protein